MQKTWLSVILATLVGGCAASGHDAPGACVDEASCTSEETTQAIASPPVCAAGPGRLTTTGGCLAGVVSSDGAMAGFLGVPFAAVPARFSDSVASPGWSGLRQATQTAPVCPQFNALPRGTFLGFNPIAPESESDCLSLNVWRPTRPGPHPIFVFFHGGAFIADAGSLPLYNDFPLLARDAIVVNVNTRLGPLGFLAHPALSALSPTGGSGSYLMSDVVTALRWVNDNAVLLGGSRQQITIFGQSSGAGLVLGALTSPRAIGLFTSAIVESGPFFHRGMRPQPLAEAEAFGVEFVKLLGCDSPDATQVVQCLRALDLSVIESVWKSHALDGAVTLNGRSSGLPMDGQLLTRTFNDAFRSGAFARVPIVLGSNRIEAPQLLSGDWSVVTGKLLVQAGALGITDTQTMLRLYGPASYADPTAALTDFQTDTQFRCSALPMSRAIAAAGVPVRVYDFNYVPSYSPIGTVFHGAELQLLFGARAVQAVLTLEDRRVGDILRQAWLSFARGAPRVGDLAWPLFAGAARLEFGSAPRITRDFRATQCQFLESQGIY